MTGNTDKNFGMGNRIKLFVLAASAAIAIVGCQQPAAGPVIEEKVPAGRQNISIHELAAALDLRVTEENPTYVTLKNQANTVMIFTLSGGQLYVNTQSIGEVSPIDRTGGQIYVSRSLIARIRSAIRAYNPLLPPSAPVPRRLSGTVVIDPGHGGKDPGATSVLGFYEKGVNLAVALDVARLLEQRGLRGKCHRPFDVRHGSKQLRSSNGELPRPDRNSRTRRPCRVRLSLEPQRGRPAAKQLLPEPPRRGSRRRYQRLFRLTNYIRILFEKHFLHLTFLVSYSIILQRAAQVDM
jgi:hypothetical protein